MRPRGFKTGGVSHCWHCNRQLVRQRGGFNFALLVQQDGRDVRVHHQCVREAVGDGVKVKPT